MKTTTEQRQKVVPYATGQVLEIGIGSGLNLPYYRPADTKGVVGLDLSPEIWNLRNEEMINSFDFGVEFVAGNAVDMPFESNTFDTALVTYTLCSIDELELVFEELRRVLKPGAQLVFCEHGKAPDPRVFRWQKRLDPIWRVFSGGCSLQKDIPNIITTNGFRLGELNEMYVPGWGLGSYNYWGRAVPR